MNISKSSWHYRLNSKLVNRPIGDESLCLYFWRTFFSLFQIAFMIFVGFFTLLVASVFWDVLFNGFGEGEKATPESVFIFSGIINFIILCFVSAAFDLDKKLKKFLPNKSKPKVKKPLEPSLLWEYIKAKKQKICPLIRFKDE